jgi:hypothetical protein
LLDGKSNGLGEWEASANGTARAIDLIPKDVMLCDWHYEQDVPTAPYLAMKGFHVVTCPWKSSQLAVWQAHDMAHWRSRSPAELKDRFEGVMQTVWSGAGSFLNKDYNSEPDATNSWNCFTAMFGEIKKLQPEDEMKRGRLFCGCAALALQLRGGRRSSHQRQSARAAGPPGGLVGRTALRAGPMGRQSVSLDSGQTLFERNADKLLKPASNAKLYTAALALDRLGPDYRIQTSFYAAAKPDAEGVIHGDLLVYGRGDPSFSARFNGGDYKKALAAGPRRPAGRRSQED